MSRLDAAFPDYDQLCERMVVALRPLITSGHRFEAFNLLDKFFVAMDDGDEPWMRTHLGEAEAMVVKAGLA